jgi:hypothetical protein
MDTETGAMNELTTDSLAQAPPFTPDGRRLVFGGRIARLPSRPGNV